MYIGSRPPSMTKTFGYRRVEILAAMLNGLALWAVVGMILHEAYGRFISPQPVDPTGMMVIAALGLGINLISIKVLHSHKDESINIRGAFLHVVADSLGSVGALVAALIIWRTGWFLIDPLVSVLICALILWSSWGLVRDALHILMLGVPAHLDYREVEGAMLGEQGVCCVYDLHIWSIASGHEALSAHLVVPDGYEQPQELLLRLNKMLAHRFSIEHSTLQIEQSHEMLEGHNAVCRVDGASNGCAYHPRGESDK